MKLITLAFAIILSLSISAKSITELTDTYDIRAYSPINYGLKDLYFEIRLEGLLNSVKERIKGIDVDDIYYKVYWAFPGRYEVVVEGLPKGFKELKAQLRSLVINRIDFVVPKKLKPVTRGYKFSLVSEKEGYRLFKGVDPTHQKSFAEILLGFNKVGQLDSFELRSPAGVQKSKLAMKTRPWSHNKWVLDKNTMLKIKGHQKTTIESNLEYLNSDGYGFPKSVTINTLESIQAPGENGKKLERNSTTVIRFSNYRPNKGIGAKFLKTASP